MIWIPVCWATRLTHAWAGITYDGYFLNIDDAIGIGADADESFLKGCEKFEIR